MSNGYSNKWFPTRIRRPVLVDPVEEAMDWGDYGPEVADDGTVGVYNTRTIEAFAAYIEHPIYTGLLPRRYHAAKHLLCKHLRWRSEWNYHERNPMRRTKKMPKSAFTKRACAILRHLKSLGVVLDMDKDNPFRFYQHAPSGQPPETFRMLWAKDHVFRAAAVHEIRRTKVYDWNTLIESALQTQKVVTRRLIKPFRRMLAERRINFAVAKMLATESRETQHMQFTTFPKAAFRSEKKLQSAQLALDIRRVVKNAGRKPAPCVRPNLKWLNAKIGTEHLFFMERFINCGGVPPTSLRGILKLCDDMHDQSSDAYLFVHSRNLRFMVVVTPIPELPDIGNVEFEILTTRQRVIEEGQKMHHCIAGYAGAKGLFLHVTRDGEHATVFVSSTHSETRGHHNSENSLARDIRKHWMPIIEQWIDTAQYKLADSPLKIPSYD